MKQFLNNTLWTLKIALGCAVFALGFDLFLEPSGLNAGGISGLAMIFVHMTDFGTVGLVTVLVNLPLFFVGGQRIGKRFFVGSIFGTVFFSLFVDLFALIPPLNAEPLLASLYGGLLCGVGLGIVIAAGASTGGSDIVVRLIKQRFRNLPIGQITLMFDVVVCALTGLVFGDISNMLYCLIVVFLSGQVIDMVVYHFDYSKIAYVISPLHEQIAAAISSKLDRGVTYLHGQGFYSQKDTKVILTAVKRGQLVELKDLVVAIDPDAFIIVLEAHQVLGDGFSRHSQDSL